MPCCWSVGEGWNWLCSVTDSPNTPLTAAKPLSLIFNAGNTLLISSSKLSKTMKITRIPLASWSIILLVQTVFPSLPHLPMLSAQSSLCFVLVSDFSCYFPFSWRYLQWLFALRKQRKIIEIIDRDREAMYIIKEWNMVLNFLEHWIWIVWCIGCSSKLYLHMRKYI